MSSGHDHEGARSIHAARAREPSILTSAGGALLHPIAITAVAVLVLNDHWWKRAHPSFLTGKISDVAGLVFFPLLLQSLVEGALARANRYEGPSMKLLFVTTSITAAGFAWVKTTQVGHDAYGLVLGALRWPFEAAFAFLRGRSSTPFDRPEIVRDPSDLIAFVGFAFTYLAACARTNRAVETETSSTPRDRHV